MKSILLSIKPKYVELIASGKKTIEVRKSAPKEVPFKAYIYCTIGNGVKGDYLVPSGIQCGKVIGEFVCHNVGKYPYEFFADGSHLMSYEDFEKMCLDGWDLYDYLRTKDGYGWHISDLKIYDKPRELGDFKKHCHYKDRNLYCLANECEYYSDWTGICCNWVERPPQSWMYVEDLGEEE